VSNWDVLVYQSKSVVFAYVDSDHDIVAIFHERFVINGSISVVLNVAKSQVFIIHRLPRSQVLIKLFIVTHFEKSNVQYKSDHIRPQDVFQSIIIHVVHLNDQSLVSIICFIY
jgi:hypothetical protein